MASAGAVFGIAEFMEMMFTRPRSAHDEASTVCSRECDRNARKWSQSNLVIQGLHHLSAEECVWKGARLKLIGNVHFCELQTHYGLWDNGEPCFWQKRGVLLVNTKNNPV